MGKVDIAAMMAGMRAQLERDQADGKLAGLTVDALMRRRVCRLHLRISRSDVSHRRNG
jgi:hypothetical protein